MDEFRKIYLVGQPADGPGFGYLFIPHPAPKAVALLYQWSPGKWYSFSVSSRYSLPTATPYGGPYRTRDEAASMASSYSKGRWS